MVRRKIKITQIENPTARRVTFLKRRGGLLKKAHDLSVLCDAEVGVIIFSSKGQLFQYAHPSMESVLERYAKSGGDMNAPRSNSSSHIVEAHDILTHTLKNLKSNLSGDDLERLSLRDVVHLEQQMLGRLEHIHAKKDELLLKELENAIEKVIGIRRSTTSNSKILQKLSDFGPSEVTGSRNLVGQAGSKHQCVQETPQTDASLPIWGGASERVHEDLPTAKRCFLLEDLNKSPACTEE